VLGSIDVFRLTRARYMPADDPPADAPPPGRANFLQIVLAVFWSFFGVRKRRNLERDMATIKPQHIIVAGVIGGLLFVLALLGLVRLILANV
jgi:Protein of unknown function (DUF2970)